MREILHYLAPVGAVTLEGFKEAFGLFLSPPQMSLAFYGALREGLVGTKAGKVVPLEGQELVCILMLCEQN